MDAPNRYYKKVKRELEGPCNICGRVSKLTWDHTPPKNCGNQYPLHLSSIFEGWNDNTKTFPDAQNGLKYRTICESCNNGLLGGEYDRTMIEYTNSITQMLFSKLAFPQIIHTEVKINRLCRAICGHFLSALAKYDDKNTVENELREYFLNKSALPPKDMQLLNWIYLYKSIVVLRNYAVKSYSTTVHYPDGLVSSMSSFPVAYVLHDGTDNCGLVNLFSFCSSDIDEVVSIPIDFSSIYYPGQTNFRDMLWPSNISEEDDGVAFVLGVDEYLESSVVAVHSDDNVKKIKAAYRAAHKK